MTSAGVHLFDRSTGLNILLDELVSDPAEWSTAPRQVSVALTNACDLRCVYCYAPKTPGRLQVDKLVGWLSELDEQGCLGIGFGGGEPTLLQDLPALCQRLAAETRLAITLTSHGHRLDAELCARLKGAVHFVRISMDGVGATYERLRELNRSGYDRDRVAYTSTMLAGSFFVWKAASCGVVVTYETIRQWCRKFGQTYANGLRRRRARPGDK